MDSKELEAQAISLWRQYRYFLPGQVKNFFRNVADFCQWEKLKEELQK